MPSCPTCDREFDSDRGMRIHHGKVHNETLDHEKQICENCGGEYSVSQYRKEDTKFCSMECVYDGDTHENNIPEKECKYCNKTFESYESEFCSRECYGEWLSKNITGSRHPNWVGGCESYRGKNWDQQRKKALERDNYTCQDCKMGMEKHIEQYGCSLHVHHIKPFRHFDSYENANKLDNLITLCSSCHKTREFELL